MIILVVLAVFFGIPAVKYLYLTVWDRYRPPNPHKEVKDEGLASKAKTKPKPPKPLTIAEIEEIVNTIKFKEIQ